MTSLCPSSEWGGPSGSFNQDYPVGMAPKGISGRTTTRTEGDSNILPMPSQAGKTPIPCEYLPKLGKALGIQRGLSSALALKELRVPWRKQLSNGVQLRRVLSLTSSVAWGALNLSRP